MDSFDYWRLCDELTIVQTAHLVIGMLPGEVEARARNGAEMKPSSHVAYVTSLDAALGAISTALRNGAISGQHIPNFNCDLDGNRTTAIAHSTNFDESLVNVNSLQKWLASRGFKKGFFFPNEAAAADYLDQDNPRYAPKLAAAVRAWQAVTDTKGRHPKQAIAKWLREHASEFQMTDEDGNVINQAIDDVSKIANWQMTGGAPKTPNE